MWHFCQYIEEIKLSVGTVIKLTYPYAHKADDFSPYKKTFITKEELIR